MADRTKRVRHTSTREGVASRAARRPGVRGKASYRSSTTRSSHSPHASAQVDFSGLSPLWTKEGSRQTANDHCVFDTLRSIGRVCVMLLGLLFRGISWVGQTFYSLISRSRIARGVTIMVAGLLLIGIIDLGMNIDKAYTGVHIGQIEVGGKTSSEMYDLVEETYGSRLEEGSVTIYASDEAVALVADEITQAEDAALAEQRSVEDARAKKLLWTTDARGLSATLPIDDLVVDALAVGRENGGFGARLAALFGGWTVDVGASYGKDDLEALVSDIDATIGTPRVDFNITVNEGVAVVTEGYEGDMIDRATFERELDRALLTEMDGDRSFVAHVEHASLRIDRTEAQATCDAVNEAIADGARFTYEGSTWDASSVELGSWVATRIEDGTGSWNLTAYVDEALAKPAILTYVQANHDDDPIHVTFEKSYDGAVMVRTDGTGTIPLVAETVRTLNAMLFGDEDYLVDEDQGGNADSENESEDGGRGNLAGAKEGQLVEIAVTRGFAPELLTFDEALSLGLISSISSYTTDYSSGSGTENRNHNIHLAADLLTDSITRSGECWSFNGTAGECNAERGFLGAGAIVDGVYDDAIGGGICQVATTVFNAVYEAGYPVPTRHNHSLYIASYPAGRDAAVSWSDLDLVWENDGESDVLMRLTYTETSVTATLYGVDPAYRVNTVVGTWTESEKHDTKIERNEGMAPGTRYIKTAGSDGRSIVVVRSVSTSEGAIVHEDAFYSTYDPVTEIVVAGPDKEDENGDADSATVKETTGER